MKDRPDGRDVLVLTSPLYVCDSLPSLIPPPLLGRAVPCPHSLAFPISLLPSSFSALSSYLPTKISSLVTLPLLLSSSSSPCLTLTLVFPSSFRSFFFPFLLLSPCYLSLTLPHVYILHITFFFLYLTSTVYYWPCSPHLVVPRIANSR